MKYESYFLDGRSAVEHLALETALLEVHEGMDGLLLFYVNDSCVIIGRNQNPWKEVSPRSAFPLYRRSSGGGAVYHDPGNLNWSLIVPRELHSREDELASIAAAVSSLGYPVAPGERGGLFCRPDTACPGAKVTGTARRFGPRNVLHHGTLLVSSDLEALHGALGGIPTEADASLPSVPAHPVNLISFGPRRGIPELAEGISTYLTGAGPIQSAFAADACPVMKAYPVFIRERDLLADPDWIYGATPRFAVRLGAGADAPVVGVEKGKVVSVDIPERWSEKDRAALETRIGSGFSYSLNEELMAAAGAASRRV